MGCYLCVGFRCPSFLGMLWSAAADDEGEGRLYLKLSDVFVDPVHGINCNIFYASKSECLFMTVQRVPCGAVWAIVFMRRAFCCADPFRFFVCWNEFEI